MTYQDKLFKNILLMLLISALSFVLYGNNVCFAYKLTILHTNDIHGHLEPFDYFSDNAPVGGVARMAELIEQIKTSNKNTLTLDAGDIAQGTLYYNFFNGIPNMEFMSQMGYDAAEIGNHEFDRDTDILDQMVKAAKFPVLCSNIKFLNDNYLDHNVKKYIIKDYNGFKVGIIGIITYNLKTLVSNPDNIDVFDDITTTKKIVRKIKNKVDLIIVLSHAGVDEDKKLAQAVPEINVIVGGHSHTFLKQPIIIEHPIFNYGFVSEGLRPSNTKYSTKALIVQDGEFGVDLGRLDIDFDHKKINEFKYALIPVDNQIKENQNITQKLSLLTQKLDYLKNTVIGELKTPLDARRNSVRTVLTNAGALVTESIRSKFPDVGFVMINSGGIRAHRYIKPCLLNMMDMFELYPFDNTVVLFRLKGKDIKSVLETSARNLPEGSGAFLQTSGLEYTVDLSQAPQKLSGDSTRIIKQGNRIKDIKINNIPIDMNHYYKVASNDFLANGGDGYSQLKGLKNVVNTRFYLRDLIIDYIKHNSPVSIEIKDRVNIINTMN